MMRTFVVLLAPVVIGVKKFLVAVAASIVVVGELGLPPVLPFELILLLKEVDHDWVRYS